MSTACRMRIIRTATFYICCRFVVASSVISCMAMMYLYQWMLPNCHQRTYALSISVRTGRPRTAITSLHWQPWASLYLREWGHVPCLPQMDQFQVAWWHSHGMRPSHPSWFPLPCLRPYYRSPTLYILSPYTCLTLYKAVALQRKLAVPSCSCWKTAAGVAGEL